MIRLLVIDLSSKYVDDLKAGRISQKEYIQRRKALDDLVELADDFEARTIDDMYAQYIKERRVNNASKGS